jgi:hypothetical protein
MCIHSFRSYFARIKSSRALFKLRPIGLPYIMGENQFRGHIAGTISVCHFKIAVNCNEDARKLRIIIILESSRRVGVGRVRKLPVSGRIGLPVFV